MGLWLRERGSPPASEQVQNQVDSAARGSQGNDESRIPHGLCRPLHGGSAPFHLSDKLTEISVQIM